MTLLSKAPWILALPLLGVGCGGGGSDPVGNNTVPAGFTTHSVTSYTAAAVGRGDTAATQDLLTGGLGKTGLGAAAPAYVDPLKPTALELRRNALYSNYRGLVDPTNGGGYSRIYGPNIDDSGNDTLGEGLIPGKEYLASLDDGTGRKRVVVAVQIPTSFDTANPCIVAGPSSGSRGVYGAIATAGEWGLKHKCAVVLTDAGKGVGIYDPTDDSVNKVDGTRTTRTLAGALSFFAAAISDLVSFNRDFPNRLAIKHAHSQQNPEKDWGLDTLASIRYALYALNEEYGTPVVGGTGKDARFTAANTTIIAASVSNGGAAVLRAAEQDADGLIDAVVAGEPSAQPRVPGGATAGYGIKVGGVAVPVYGLPLIDYFTFANLYQPCAAIAPAVSMTEISFYNRLALPADNMLARAGFRCDSLAAQGLLPGRTLGNARDLLSADSLQMLRDYGFSPENDTMHNAHYGLGNAPIISTMYTNALGRFGVEDNLCNMSMAQTDPVTGAVVPVSATTLAQSFAVANGTSNGTPATPVVNDALGGAPRAWQFATSALNGVRDLGIDGAQCQRALVTGIHTVTGLPLTADTTPTKVQSDRVRAGMAEVLLNGNLRGKPTLIVAGRSDALLPLNHSERAYVAFNRMVEGEATSQLRYVEVENAQHFDSFLPFSGFGMRFVPLHPYFIRAMDAMWAKLKTGAALPPNQVVRTTVRGGTPDVVPALSVNQIRNFVATPAPGDVIGFAAGNVIDIPN
ncbi:D-(-)-3-hydroxybutyrate oligomer hydrolase [Rubrivivax sp. A210]|nr:D-(-)-3-hydroxybutyrate oligomer hydrolase [Rubrivivax sp. A210]CAD5374346.1 D-(-)-3-hydroxybutyrate oligomer hydrolase [Rubrivivax sp. A210]